jgi:hypothetical protein
VYAGSDGASGEAAGGLDSAGAELSGGAAEPAEPESDVLQANRVSAKLIKRKSARIFFIFSLHVC